MEGRGTADSVSLERLGKDLASPEEGKSTKRGLKMTPDEEQKGDWGKEKKGVVTL